MQAGRLNERCVIQRQSEERDEFGATKYTYSNIYNPYCSTEWLNGSKSLKNGEFVPTERIAFTIRDHYQVTEFDRVLYDGKKYAIVSICKKRSIQAIEIVGEVINE